MRLTIYLLLLSTGLTSCVKYLEDKPSKAQVVPQTLTDFQSLLDNAYALNQGAPSAGEIASDDLFVTTTDWLAQTNTTGRNAYSWNRDLFPEDENDWSWAYHWILHANIVLDGLSALDKATIETSAGKNCRGSALFFRAHAFFQLAQEFCRTYDATTAATDPGIVLRLSANITERSVRSTVQQTYQRIITDLEEAAHLLPVTPLYKTRPSRQAALALLARTAVVTNNAKAAKQYADSALALQNTLLDFNTLSPAQTNPVPRFNPEVIWHCTSFGMSILLPPVAKVDTALFQSYDTNDLRRTVFFKPLAGGYHGFYGSYDGTSALFFGLAVDEVYLIRAEALARLGETEKAMDDLNTVVSKRWKNGSFVPFTATGSQEALQFVLTERRKELVFRGLRWSDLRRLNKEAATQRVLTRYLNNQTLTLEPNESRYVFPIPAKVIALTGIEQNP